MDRSQCGIGSGTFRNSRGWKSDFKISYQGSFEENLDRLGTMPLPPYIVEKLEDQEMYQTVYAKRGESVAAPTAGLHFTKELLEKIQEKVLKL